ncbi:hypothetical protein [Microbispora sp. ATCC PTA-5024]|uniref:hypothetical protein n=1 Tax=Microbispora sp. ATCC PTA-5024 TaxID=316330 RepID=UPI000405A472|nr:hypothetical protein [Microbispora sp. ATCC PTA-5024]
MVRWRAGRRTLAAAVVSVAGGVLLALPLTSARAEAVEIDLNYTCVSGPQGVAPTPVNLKVTLTLQTALAVGQPLDVRWGVAYRDGTRFLSPGLFQPGARLSATGVSGISGDLWNGELNSLGYKDQALLQNGGPIELPELISGAVSTTQAGTLELVPKKLFIDFTPPASETVVNDDDPSIGYVGSDWADYNDRAPQFKDIHEDVHASEVSGAEVSFPFTGTGVDFITEQDYRAGQVQFAIDGKPGIPATADASKDENGNPVVVANQGNHTLWGMRGLPYKQHTLTVKKLDAKWAMVDGFRVVTEQIMTPPKQLQAVCTPTKKPTAVRVTIGGGDGGGGTTPPTSPSSSGSPSGSPDPSGSTPPPSGSPSPSGSAASGSPSSTPSQSQSQVVAVVVQGSPTPTATTTVTLTATPTVAQVRVTPKGGAQTGEEPVRTSASGPLLVGSGGVMLVIGVFSGVALLRRRAAHSGDRNLTV